MLCIFIVHEFELCQQAVELEQFFFSIYNVCKNSFHTLLF